MKTVEEKISTFLKRYNLLQSSNTFIIGFSGGYDSLCLLDVLYNLSLKYNFQIIACHLNHNWRGIEAEQEQQNAKNYCNARNIEFFTKTLSADLPKTEIEARNQRYVFFKEAVKKFSATALFTGHTFTDNAETVLYRVIKGTGIRGLRGILEYRSDFDCPIYRPMLDVTREENINYCAEHALAPNIDSSNENIHYLRNRIRKKLMPELKEYNQNVEMALTRLSTLAKNYQTISEEYLDKIKPQIYNENGEILSAQFFKLSDAIQTQIVYDYLAQNGIEVEFKKIEEIKSFLNDCAMLKSGNTHSVADNWLLFASQKIVKLISEKPKGVIKSIIKVEPECKTDLPQFGKTIEFTVWTDDAPKKFPKESDFKLYADLSSVKSPLYVRTRQPGDRIRPFGMQEATKLKKYLINHGIPEHLRNELVLLASEEEVLWVLGVGMSETIRVKDKPTHIIKITQQ